MSSTYIILAMTFERFYSIIMPHKAASFNTLKKAKISLVFIFTFFTVINIPHAFLSDVDGLQCIPWRRGSHLLGQIYFYVEMFIAFILPFILLVLMNSFIIHTLRTRANLIVSKSESQGQTEGQSSKMKNSEKQIYVTLLLVTFTFLILTTPVYILFIYVMSVGVGTTPRGYATYFIIYQVGEKTYFTNYAINFFLYVISGQKFRADLVKLFRCHREKQKDFSFSSEVTKSTSG